MSQLSVHSADGEGRWRVEDVVSAGPGSYQNPEAVVAHIADVTGFRPTSPTAVRGHISRRGRYRREGAGGELAVVSGSALLDTVAAPSGEILIGGQVVRPPIIPAARAAATICQPGPYEGLETCVSADGSQFDIKESDDSFVRFHSWKDKGFLRWSLGTSITVRGPHFERAAINSRYYFTAYGQVCTAIYDNDHDANDSYMAESEEGWGSDSAHRVESLCRVQWNGYRLSGMVYAGEPCFTAVPVEPFPEGFPQDWPAIEPPAAVTVSPGNLYFAVRSTNPKSTRRVTVASTFDQAVAITVSPVKINGKHPKSPFSNVSGQLSIPPNGSVAIDVKFDGSVPSGGANTDLNHWTGSFTVSSEHGSRTVRLDGRVSDVVRRT